VRVRDARTGIKRSINDSTRLMMAFGSADVDSMEPSKSRDQRQSDRETTASTKKEDSERNKRQKADDGDAVGKQIGI